jgi:hypothetical protein
MQSFTVIGSVRVWLFHLDRQASGRMGRRDEANSPSFALPLQTRLRSQTYSNVDHINKR